MPSISIPTALAIGAGVSGVAGVASAVIGGNAAKSAGKTQAKAATLASNNQLEEFNQTEQNLSPYMSAGTEALGTGESLLGLGDTSKATTPGGGTSGGVPNTTAMETALENTPGYQFTKQQGLEATQNGFAAQGLASSGAALKGAATFATGLADTTYEQQLQNYLQVAGGGQSAATAVGQQGQNAVAQAGNFSTSGAAATAAGTVGAANALTGGLSTVANGVNNAAMIDAFAGSGQFGAKTATGSVAGNALEPVAVTPNVYGGF